MTTLLLLLASFALVALIGAALMYAVNRIVAWSVDRIESRGGVVETPASDDEPAVTTPVAATPAPVAVAPSTVAPSDLVTPAAAAPVTTVQPQAGPASTAA